MSQGVVTTPSITKCGHNPAATSVSSAVSTGYFNRATLRGGIETKGACEKSP